LAEPSRLPAENDSRLFELLVNAVTDYASLGEVGGSDSRVVGYSVVTAEDMDSALALAKDCPALRVGGGVEVGPVMEAAGS